MCEPQLCHLWRFQTRLGLRSAPFFERPETFLIPLNLKVKRSTAGVSRGITSSLFYMHGHGANLFDTCTYTPFDTYTPFPITNPGVQPQLRRLSLIEVFVTPSTAFKINIKF